MRATSSARARGRTRRRCGASWPSSERFAATSFTNDDPGRQRYEALADKVRANLAPADPAQKVEGMVMELGAAAASMNAAKERHQATQSVLQDALAQNE